MSSSGECELDSESTPASRSSHRTFNPVMATHTKTTESASSVKKLVYTRKKSTSAMQRKISAEFNHKNVNASMGAEGKETEDAEESDSSPSTSSSPISNRSSSDKYLAPRSPHVKPRQYHHSPSSGSSLRKHVLVRRSPSPSATPSPGYDQYQMTLLEVPLPRDYGEASSDDLSSEWDSDAPDSRSRFLGFKVIPPWKE